MRATDTPLEASEQASAPRPGVSEKFVAALLTKDREALLGLLARGVKMQGTAPGKTWQCHDSLHLVDEILLGEIFGRDVEIEELVGARFETVLDQNSASYRLLLRQGGQQLACEQQAFFDIKDEVIYGLHLSCSGFASTAAH